jgi:transposase-like protein
MSTKQSANIPIALSQARHQLDLWRSQQPNKRTRLPREFWQQAVALAREHGLNKTARALNVKYYSLKKHFDEAGVDDERSVKPTPDFIELLPGTMTPGGVECTIEWSDGHNEMVRMHIKGAGLSELTALAGVLRSGRT